MAKDTVFYPLTIFYHSHLLCVSCVGVQLPQLSCGDQKTAWRSVFSLCCVGLRNQTQVLVPGGRNLSLEPLAQQSTHYI